MNDDIIIAQALKNVLLSDIEDYDLLPQYKIPHKLDSRISKLITDNTEPVKKEKRKPIPLKHRLLIAAIIIITMAVLTGGITVITRNLGMFKIKQYDIFSMMTIECEEDGPIAFTDKYRLVMNLSQYAKDIIGDIEYMYAVHYKNKTNERQIIFSQTSKNAYGVERLNTENAITYPELIEIGNNKDALYFETYKHDKVLIWEMGDSIIEIVAYGFSENELIELSQLVQKVE